MNLLGKDLCKKCYALIKATLNGARLYSQASPATYIQGQLANKKTREYFYYIDHQGDLFMDDTKVKNFITCFKDKVFLEFFFKRVRRNLTGRYQDTFPYLSPCGRERNFIRCDDYPIVYTHIIEKSKDYDAFEYLLSYGGAGDKLTVPFAPETLCMLPHTGRVYHAATEKLGGIGLVKSALAIEFSPGFIFNDSARPIALENGESVTLPSKFVWKGVTYDLTNELYDKVMCDFHK